MQFRSALAFVCYLGFSPIFLFPLTLPCVLKRFLLTISRKTTTTCAKKRFNAHARMLPSPRFSVASAFVPHLCFLSLLSFLSDFPISPDPPVRTKTFFTHNKSKSSHDVRRKRFNARARMLPSPRFSVASAFVPHLCFLSLLCYVRILLAPFHRPFSLLSLLTPFLCLLGVLFCSVFSDFPHLLCYLCSFRISLFSLRPLSLCFLSLLCFFSDFPRPSRAH